MPLTDTTTAARGVKRGMTQPSNSHYVGQTSGLPVAVPLAPQGVEYFVRRQISVFPLPCSK